MQYPLSQKVGSTAQFNCTVLKLCQSTVDFPVFVSVQIRQVQKSDRINSDRQSSLDQLGSTWIDSDRLKS